MLEINLKYFDGQPGIKEIKRVSKPGRRIYSSKEKIPKNYNGLGVAVLSTSRGLMTDHQARMENIGGEILFTVF
jgi:small subunit ribosomal protein S8